MSTYSTDSISTCEIEEGWGVKGRGMSQIDLILFLLLFLIFRCVIYPLITLSSWWRSLVPMLTLLTSVDINVIQLAIFFNNFLIDRHWISLRIENIVTIVAYRIICTSKNGSVITKQLPIHTLIYMKTFEQFVDEIGRTSVMSMWSDKTISLE